MIEYARVFLDARVEHHRPHHLHRSLDERRRGQHQAVWRRQLLIDRRHAAFRLLRRGRTAEDRPDLGVQIDLALVVVLGPVHRAVLGDGPDEPVAVPGVALDICVQLVTMGQRPGSLVWLAKLLRHVSVDRQPQPQLKGHKEAFAVVAQPQTVVPVGGEAAGQVVAPGALQVELQRPPQVIEYRVLTVIRVGQHGAVKVEVARLSHVNRDGVEEPQAVVGAVFLVGRRQLVAGTMLERLDDRNRTAIGKLAGQHQLQPRACSVRDGRRDAQDILHRVAEPQAVALAVVDQAGSARPGKGDQAVVQAPDVDGVVEIGVRRVHCEAAQLAVPAFLQPLQLSLRPRQRTELCHNSLTHRARVANAEHDQQFATFAWLQNQAGLHAPTGVVTVCVALAALSHLHRQRVVVTAVRTKKRLAAGVIPVQLRVDQRHPRMHTDVVLAAGPRLRRQVVVDGDAQQTVLGQAALDDEQRVLQVDLILLGHPLVGELAVGEDRESARPVAFVGDLQPPVLEVLAQRDEVGRLRRNAGVARFDGRVGRSVATGGLIAVQRLAHRLPGG